MRVFKYLLPICCFLLCYQLSGQNGWTRKAGDLYAQSVVSNFSSNRYINTESNLFDGGSRFKSSGVSLFAEYGITDRITCALDFPVLVINRFVATESVLGLGNLKMGLKYRLFENLPISLQLDLDIPTDDGIKLARTKDVNELGNYEQINLPTSDGEFNLWTILAGSQSSADGRSFGSLYVGANFRTKSFTNQWQSGLEFGHLFFDKMYLIAKVKVQERLGNTNESGASFLYGEGTTFTSYGLTIIYDVGVAWKVVGSFTEFSDFLVLRRNIYDGTLFSLGVAFEP